MRKCIKLISDTNLGKIMQALGKNKLFSLPSNLRLRNYSTLVVV